MGYVSSALLPQRLCNSRSCLASAFHVERQPLKRLKHMRIPFVKAFKALLNRGPFGHVGGALLDSTQTTVAVALALTPLYLP